MTTWTLIQPNFKNGLIEPKVIEGYDEEGVLLVEVEDVIEKLKAIQDSLGEIDEAKEYFLLFQDSFAMEKLMKLKDSSEALLINLIQELQA